MNKAELAKRLSVRLSVPQRDAIRFIDEFQDVLSEELKNDQSLCLQGFGSFSPWAQSEREGRNPKTGSSCMIPPRTSVKFKPGKYLLEKLNP
ncbi:MAG: HU family DNA-binding protein [Parabacteroides gordonii]|uniref:HU family DNA-binding protein n=1 Tax=Parabacteroides gordonii TaxID=574930 RepID=UPI003A8494C5